MISHKENESWRRSWKDARRKDAELQNSRDQAEQQRENNEGWKQGLEENLLKLINQQKVGIRISELQPKRKLKLWKHDLEQNIQEFIEQNEQQKEKFNT